MKIKTLIQSSSAAVTYDATQHILLHVTAQGKVEQTTQQKTLLERLSSMRRSMLVMKIPKSWLTIISPVPSFVSYYFRSLKVYNSCNIDIRRFYLSFVSMVIESILFQDMVCVDDNTYINSVHTNKLHLQFMRFKLNIKATRNSRLCAAVCVYMRQQVGQGRAAATTIIPNLAADLDRWKLSELTRLDLYKSIMLRTAGIKIHKYLLETNSGSCIILFYDTGIIYFVSVYHTTSHEWFGFFLNNLVSSLIKS